MTRRIAIVTALCLAMSATTGCGAFSPGRALPPPSDGPAQGQPAADPREAGEGRADPTAGGAGPENGAGQRAPTDLRVAFEPGSCLLHARAFLDGTPMRSWEVTFTVAVRLPAEAPAAGTRRVRCTVS